ncbi:magnesium transporter [archaeon]|nr:magnesium transporter [archaeon]
MIGKDFREIMGSELVSITGGLITGVILTFATNRIEMIPALLILLPGFLETRGNLSGSLSARLSAGLHLGIFKQEYNRKKIVKGNVIASFVLIVFMSLFLGFVAYYASMEFFGITNQNIIFVSLLAGIISNVIEIPLTIFATFWLFRHGHDPNNIMGPYTTTTGDIVSVISILIALSLI